MFQENKNSAEFYAVYRLEFYRNKKKWILCDQKKASMNKKDKLLNVTFDVETKGENLNEAFIETGSDSEKTSNTELCSRTPNLSQQWLESVNIWPGSVREGEDKLKSLLFGNTKDKKKQSDDEFEMQDTVPQTSYSQAGLYVLTNKHTKNENIVKYSGFDRGDNLEHHAYYQGNEFDFPERSDLPQIECPAYVPEADMADAKDVVSPLDVWNEQNNYTEEDERSISVDSYSAFCREANLNPHCTEIDIQLDDSMGQDLDANNIARMSTRELNKAIHTHTKALASLLRENAVRQKLCDSPASRETSTESVSRDRAEFVAGSFRNRQFCVRLEFGRPVRLVRETE